MMRKVINCPESKTGDPGGKGDGHLTRLPQPKCLELGLGGKSEDALEELPRLFHCRVGTPRGRGAGTWLRWFP